MHVYKDHIYVHCNAQLIIKCISTYIKCTCTSPNLSFFASTDGHLEGGGGGERWTDEIKEETADSKTFFLKKLFILSYHYSISLFHELILHATHTERGLTCRLYDY